MAQTIALEEIISCSVFRFHEDGLIFRFHELRHSKAMHMLEAEVPLIYIRNFLGHESIQTTERYLKISQGAVASAIINHATRAVLPQEISQVDGMRDNNLPDFIKRAKAYR